MKTFPVLNLSSKKVTQDISKHRFQTKLTHLHDNASSIIPPASHLGKGEVRYRSHKWTLSRFEDVGPHRTRLEKDHQKEETAQRTSGRRHACASPTKKKEKKTNKQTSFSVSSLLKNIRRSRKYLKLAGDTN